MTAAKCGRGMLRAVFLRLLEALTALPCGFILIVVAALLFRAPFAAGDACEAGAYMPT